MKREIRRIQREFQALDDWKIVGLSTKKTEHRGKCFISPVKKSAEICPWGRITRRPTDYVFHEILHCVFAALFRMKGKKQILATERTIQELCRFQREKRRIK